MACGRVHLPGMHFNTDSESRSTSGTLDRRVFPPISDDSVSFVRTALVVVVLLCTSFSTVAQIRASSLSSKALEEGPVSVIRYVHFVEIRKVVVRGFCRLIMRSYDQTPAVSLRLIPGR